VRDAVGRWVAPGWFLVAALGLHGFHVLEFCRYHHDYRAGDDVDYGYEVWGSIWEGLRGGRRFDDAEAFFMGTCFVYLCALTVAGAWVIPALRRSWLAWALVLGSALVMLAGTGVWFLVLAWTELPSDVELRPGFWCGVVASFALVAGVWCARPRRRAGTSGGG